MKRKNKRYLRTAFVARGNIILPTVLGCVFYILFFVMLLSNMEINPLITIIFLLIGMIFFGYAAFDTNFYFIDGSKIRMSILGVTYKSKPCVDINYAVVSNAKFVSNNPNANGYCLYETVQTSDGKIKRILPYLTVHNAHFLPDSLAVGMTNADVCKLSNDDESLDVGVCHFEALNEIILHTDAKIYILADVYNRYRDEFNAVMLSKFAVGRIVVVE